jgi:hypothetical protein
MTLYTLRMLYVLQPIRVSCRNQEVLHVQQGGSGEMAKLLKVPHLEGALKILQMQDGVIVFDNDVAAAQFLDSLHAAGVLSATLNEVNSHHLFRATADARNVVVLVCGGDSPSRARSPPADELPTWPTGSARRGADFVPTPAQLAAVLRGKHSMEDN